MDERPLSERLDLAYAEFRRALDIARLATEELDAHTKEFKIFLQHIGENPALARREAVEGVPAASGGTNLNNNVRGGLKPCH